MMTIILALGILNFILILFQILTGFHVITMRIKLHKIIGLMLTVTALVHGIIAFATHDADDHEHNEDGHGIHSDTVIDGHRH